MSYNSILGNLYTGISPSELVSRTAKNTGTNLATGLLAGAANKALRGAMGMDSDGCSFRFGDGRGRMGMHGDMCGRYDDPLKGAMVSLGMAIAAPYIAQTGSIIGGPIDSMIGLGRMRTVPPKYSWYLRKSMNKFCFRNSLISSSSSNSLSPFCCPNLR